MQRAPAASQAVDPRRDYNQTASARAASFPPSALRHTMVPLSQRERSSSGNAEGAGEKRASDPLERGGPGARSRRVAPRDKENSTPVEAWPVCDEHMYVL